MDRDRRAGPDVVPDKSRIAFLDIGRALAALLVVYTHIYNVFLSEFKHTTTWPTDAIDNTLVFPLRLEVQGIGAIAVPLFFMISGFVVTPIALKLGAGRFGVNRLLRIYPLLFFVVGISAVLVAVGPMPLATRPQPVTFGNVLSQATLYNFIDRPFGAWVGVAWTLAVEVLFYAMLVALLPLLRKRVWLAIAIELWLIAILLITNQAFGAEYRAIVINMVYTTIPIMGQAMWAAWHGKIPAWLAGVYAFVAWLLFVWAGHLDVDPDYVPRAFPIGLAFGVFLIGLFAEPYLRQRRFWTALSERTYSIYLLHGAVAFPLLRVLFDQLPLWLTVLIAVAATGVSAELTYRFVELPSHRLARRLSRRRAREKEAANQEEPEELDEDELELDPDETPTERAEPVSAPEPPPRPRPVAARNGVRLPPPILPPTNGNGRRLRHGIGSRSLEGTTRRSANGTPVGSRSEPANSGDLHPTTGDLAEPSNGRTPFSDSPGSRNGATPRSAIRPDRHDRFEPDLFQPNRHDLDRNERDRPDRDRNDHAWPGPDAERHPAPAEPANGRSWLEEAARRNGSSGGRRRRPDPPEDSGAASPYTWPGESDDVDRRAEAPQGGGGRHRAKP